MKVTQFVNMEFYDDFIIVNNFNYQLNLLGCDSKIAYDITDDISGLVHAHNPIHALSLKEVNIPYVFSIHKHYLTDNVYDINIIKESIKGSIISLYHDTELTNDLITNKVFYLDLKQPLDVVGNKLYKMLQTVLLIKKDYSSEETKKLFIENYKVIKEYVDIDVNYVNGFTLNLKTNTDKEYLVNVKDSKNNIVYSSLLRNDMWLKLSKQYLEYFTYEVLFNNEVIKSGDLSFEDKKVFIVFDSHSLGDTIAWVPYCLEFKKKHNCDVVVSMKWYELFRSVYPEIEFVPPGSTVYNIAGMFVLGWFWDLQKEPVLPNTIPLQKSATNILDLEYEEIRPRIDFKKSDKPYEGKYVTITIHSTSGLKHWNHPNGWQRIVDYLISNDYKVICVSKEETKINGVIIPEDLSINNTMNIIHHSEFFIGLSSGLSWLSWALEKHVVMISNFTTEDHEFTSNCTRITNPSVCNSCWNNPLFKFDKGDWFWCPEFKDTPRQFECHTSITPEMVIERIQHLL
jgi:autotransporter strand-loop-strand O-heptosyltransferase